MDSRHGFGRLGSRWPRQAWRGGRKSREDGSECRRISWRWRRTARLCSASEKSFDYGRWSKWPARREHDPTEGQERHGFVSVVASGKSLWYGPYPSGKREETTATREFRRFYGFFVSMILSIKLIRSFPATSTFRSARIAPMIGFWASNSIRLYLEKHNIWMRDSQNSILKLNLSYLTWQKMHFFLSVLNKQMM